MELNEGGKNPRDKCEIYMGITMTNKNCMLWKEPEISTMEEQLVKVTETAERTKLI